VVIGFELILDLGSIWVAREIEKVSIKLSKDFLMTIEVGSNWQPAAESAVLVERSRIIATLRAFLTHKGVLEVEVPILGSYSVNDLYIDSFEVLSERFEGFLQTSPESYMKRLLAAGSGDIFALGKAFRAGEIGVNHNPEFTLLEWYRVGWDEHELMTELAELVTSLKPSLGCLTMSYQDAFIQHLGIDPHNICLSNLQKHVSSRGGDKLSTESRFDCLNYLFTIGVEPKLPEGLVFLYDYPECHAAFAQLHCNREGQWVSRRFEVYLNRLELANGYFELTDPEEQHRRFVKDRQARITMNKQTFGEDKSALAALHDGLPSCSGVALGVDRLIMQLLNKKSIQQVMTFSWDKR
tara:strand:- start:1616 stop:2674 length:1059 start_codon:yes stop_codon:yes gene_type:complete